MRNAYIDNSITFLSTLATVASPILNYTLNLNQDQGTPYKLEVCWSNGNLFPGMDILDTNTYDNLRLSTTVNVVYNMTGYPSQS